MSNNGKTKRLRAILIKRDGTCCHYCGCEMTMDFWHDPHAMTVEHIIPQIQGGTDDMDNLVLACRNCNSSKNKKNYQEYRMKLDTDNTLRFLMGDEL